MVTTAQTDTHSHHSLPPAPLRPRHTYYTSTPPAAAATRLLGHGWRRCCCCIECVEYAVHLDTHGRHLLVPLHQLLQAVLKIDERLHLWQRVCACQRAAATGAVQQTVSSMHLACAHAHVMPPGSALLTRYRRKRDTTASQQCGVAACTGTQSSVTTCWSSPPCSSSWPTHTALLRQLLIRTGL